MKLVELKKQASNLLLSSKLENQKKEAIRMINKIEKINRIEYHFSNRNELKKSFITEKRIEIQKINDFKNILEIELNKIDIYI